MSVVGIDYWYRYGLLVIGYGYRLAWRSFTERGKREGTHKRHMDQRKVIVAHAELELPHRFDEGRGLDVADCAAELVERGSVRVGWARWGCRFGS